jgi:4-hydroxythreonine-4-phosphate dehydrogenase
LIALGSIGRLQREVDRFKLSVKLTRIDGPESAPDDHETLGVIEASSVDVSYATIGKVDAGCGQAAVAYLMGAIDLARDRRIDGIMTLPINKEGIHRAGFDFPGHTEILADAFGVKHYAMALYRRGLGVAHVTLHQSLRSVFDSLTAEAIVEKIELLDGLMKRLGVAKPRIGVAALNPHAGDGGLFGDEEKTIVAPAVEKARGRGIESSGPWPVDTLFARAGEGGYDGVVALYHDQGHIALKVMGWRQAVNITLGLPIVRTSVAHGTAYDIAGKSPADTTGFHEAVSAAVKLIATS